MKYIINLTLIFDPDSQLLMLKNNNLLTVGLSNPATRLLSELIRNNKIELTRETLIKRVWEDYGFSPSSATLSNHISELRKAFEALGVSKDILITVPRIGFKMEAEIHPETKPAKEPVPETLASQSQQAAEENVVADDVAVSSQKPSHKIKRAALFLLLVLSVTAVITAWVTLSENEQPSLIGTQDKCRIYTLDKGKPGSEQAGRARKMLADEGIDCTQTDRDIYYMEARPANYLLKVSFMAACVKNSDMSYTNCNNFKQVK
ncbi:winged helix-turn-helix domain-containing protein [Serratia bockelmannii]|uniref:winged helix-turn-helix domain-containing protein n=1 Tax=Serratia bockelmannii TaxID=2703793 RepID=UPI003F6D03DC